MTPYLPAGQREPVAADFTGPVAPPEENGPPAPHARTNGGHTNGAGFVAPAATAAALDAATIPSPGAIHVLTTEQLFAEEISDSLLLPKLGIGSGPPIGIVGQAYAGKSLLSLSLGLSVSFERPVWGAWKARQGSWLHLDYDQGRRHTKSRIHRLALGLGISPDELRAGHDGGAFAIAIYPELLLTNPKALQLLCKAFEGKSLVTLDALRPMLGGVDENSSQVRALIHLLSSASESTGAAVVLLHHAGKTPIEGKRARKEISRGSSGIVDELQSLFVMTKIKGDRQALVTHEKDRELGYLVDDFGLTIEDIHTDDGNPKGALRVTVAKVQNAAEEAVQKTLLAVREYVFRMPGVAGIGVLADGLGMRKQSVGAAVNQLLAEGVIIARFSTPQGGGKMVQFYLATAAPKEESQ